MSGGAVPQSSQPAEIHAKNGSILRPFWFFLLLTYGVTWVPLVVRYLLKSSYGYEAVWTNRLGASTGVYGWWIVAITIPFVIVRVIHKTSLFRAVALTIGAVGFVWNVASIILLFDRNITDTEILGAIVQALVLLGFAITLVYRFVADRNAERALISQTGARKSHPFFRMWIAANGVTWIPGFLGLLIAGLLIRDVFFSYESMGLLLLLTYGVAGIILCAVLSGLFIAFRNMRKPQGMRYVFLVASILGAFAYIAYIVSILRIEYRELIVHSVLAFGIFLAFFAYGFRAWWKTRVVTADAAPPPSQRFVDSRTLGIIGAVVAIGIVLAVAVFILWAQLKGRL